MSGGKLPEGWVKTTIGVICEVKGGKRLPKGKALLNTETEHPYIRVTDFENGSVNLSTIKYLDSDTYSAISNYTISKNDLYISIAGTIGLIGEIPEQLDNANLTENAAKLCSILGTDKKYLKYVLSSNKIIEQFDDKTTSSGQPKLALFRIRDCEFPYASINEQKIIAEKLDTLLAQVDNTKARLEQIPQILKRFRQAVLAAAVTGRLTKENNDYTKKTIELDNYKISIPKKWTETILNNVINTQRPLCYGVVQPGDDINDGIELIRVCDINDGEVDLNHLRKISKEIDIQYKRSKVQKNDILVTIVGAIGRIGIVREDINVNIARAVARVSPECKLIKPMFLHIWLSSPVMQTWLVQSSKEVARKTLNLKDLKEAFVPLPSIEEQAEIVRRVEQLFAYTDTIEKQVNSALTRVNNLTQSILAKAFRGELTAQWRAENPSLISGENSAAALLEKIKAERAASGGNKTSRKKS
ncbi:restriction endonuclease subunit S [Citrobacter sp. Res13-Sevr-PEB04-36]|uniref:restriction endonuclease subunit S n=1 Tax=Citrobacter sp. Res13-Sevr-PEB04-36 TaxID=2777960 RepID=UPI0018AC9402|nr:restriction endonuclease subunit S [Citrobacter sp. Res13-Sevr-PEB04-36]